MPAGTLVGNPNLTALFCVNVAPAGAAIVKSALELAAILGKFNEAELL